MIQAQSIILPTVWSIGTETETINDLVEHISLEVRTEQLQEKIVHVVATEVVVVGVPGNLEAWIEVSPYPSANSPEWPANYPTSTAYWAAVGGGGGAMAPVAPLVEAATGVNLTVHTFTLAWQIHQPWARLVMQVPVAKAPAPATAYWVVQAMISAKGP